MSEATAKISAGQVKELRDKTGIGMNECKKALEESGGDMNAAIKVLRERGAMKAEKREGRTAAEGLVAAAVAADSRRGSVALLTSETDFVARNDEFSALVAGIVKSGLAAGAKNVATAGEVKLADGRVAKTAVEDIRIKIGEKIELAAFESLEGDVVASYIHPPGKIGVLVSASAPGVDAAKAAKIAEGLRDVAMHVAAFSPRFLDNTSVDAATLDAEREIYAVQSRNEGKKEELIPKIVEGKVRAFYKDNCLVDQAFAKDPSKSVTQYVAELSKATGAQIKLTGFRRVNVGQTGEAKS